MTRVLAPQVRNSLAAIINRLPSGGLTTEKIIAALQRDHAKEIVAETADLLHIALVRLVSQVGALRSKSTINLQAELFHEYAVQRRLNLTVETPKGNKKVWKKIDDVTIAETERYIAEHERPPVRMSPEAKELSRLLADVKDYATSTDEKLVEAYAAAKAAGK